uniref:Uncharacterized protein n=1 Tax=Acrobeloides nanus TaxID=290746 RepID=A0A914E3G8_9BILA
MARELSQRKEHDRESDPGGMRGAQPTTGVTSKLLGLLRMPNASEPGDSTCSRLRKPNLDASGPTLLNLQDRTVRRCTERTMLLLKQLNFALF